MSDAQKPPESGKSALENKLESMGAVYQRFGRDGLKDYPIADVTALLASKQLELRDAPKGREIGEQQKEANRLLELEIRDLTGHVEAHLSGAGLSSLQRFATRSQPQQQPPTYPKFKPKDRSFEPER